jgi:hypothetical protein
MSVLPAHKLKESAAGPSSVQTLTWRVMPQPLASNAQAGRAEGNSPQ